MYVAPDIVSASGCSESLFAASMEFVFFSFVVILRVSRAAAWSVDGHMIIAHIAESLMKAKHRERIANMLRGGLADLSNWEATSVGSWPGAASLHRHWERPPWTCASRNPPSCAAEDGAGSLLCALAFFFEHLHVAEKYPPSKHSANLPKTLRDLATVPSDMLTPVQYLRWLVILIGDLHQPTHWMQTHEYGQSVALEHGGHRCSLSSFWEDYIPKALGSSNLSKLSLPKNQDRLSRWRGKTPVDLFFEWASDEAGVACSEVLLKLEVNHADGSRRLNEITKVTSGMESEWIRIAEDRFILAGQRVAFLLTNMLKHKRHTKTNTSSERVVVAPRLRGATVVDAKHPVVNVISDEREVGL